MIIENTLVYLAIGAALAVPTIFIAILARGIMKATARNPAASTKIFLGMVLMLLVVEGIVIATIVLIFRLFVYES